MRRTNGKEKEASVLASISSFSLTIPINGIKCNAYCGPHDRGQISESTYKSILAL